jgi:hypothetical protein
MFQNETYLGHTSLLDFQPQLEINSMLKTPCGILLQLAHKDQAPDWKGASDAPGLEASELR